MWVGASWYEKNDRDGKGKQALEESSNADCSLPISLHSKSLPHHWRNRGIGLAAEYAWRITRIREAGACLFTLAARDSGQAASSS
jgi:hypothetical protein